MSEVFLRALETADLDRLYRWHNSAALYSSLGGHYRPVSIASEAEWLKARQQNQHNEVSFAICAMPEGDHVGNIYLRNIDWVARRGELHVFIGDSGRQGKGLGRGAIMQLLEYASRTLGLRRIYLEVLADNHRAIRAYLACGFVVEGTLRQHAFKNGHFQDVILMGWLAEEDTLQDKPGNED